MAKNEFFIAYTIGYLEAAKKNTGLSSNSTFFIDQALKHIDNGFTWLPPVENKHFIETARQELAKDPAWKGKEVSEGFEHTMNLALGYFSDKDKNP